MVENINSSVLEDMIESNKVVIADFYATWCGPCKMMHPISEECAAGQTDINFVRLDVDENMEYAQKAAIQFVPTFIIYAGGKEVARKSGYIPKEEFELFVKLASQCK